MYCFILDLDTFNEIKIHIKSVYFHMFEATRLLLITNAIYENNEESKLVYMTFNGQDLIMFAHALWMHQLKEDV